MPTFKAYKDGSQLETILGADPRALQVCLTRDAGMLTDSVQTLIQTNLA